MYHSIIEIKKNVPKSYRKLMTSDEAAQLKSYMQAVVEEGTGMLLSGQTYTAAGKTHIDLYLRVVRINLAAWK